MSFPDAIIPEDLDHSKYVPPPSFGESLEPLVKGCVPPENRNAESDPPCIRHGPTVHDFLPYTGVQPGTVSKPNVLQEALAATQGPRAEAYGPPEINWARTSRIAIALTELDCLTPEVCVKVAMAMKFARLLQTPDHHDTLVDIPGYGWVLSRVVENQ